MRNLEMKSLPIHGIVLCSRLQMLLLLYCGWVCSSSLQPTKVYKHNSVSLSTYAIVLISILLIDNNLLDLLCYILMATIRSWQPSTGVAYKKRYY